MRAQAAMLSAQNTATCYAQQGYGAAQGAYGQAQGMAQQAYGQAQGMAGQAYGAAQGVAQAGKQAAYDAAGNLLGYF